MATVPVPKSFGVNEVLTAATMNKELRDAVNFILNPPRVFASGVNQTVATAVYTPVAMPNETYDTDGMHDPATNNSRITIVTPGLYDLKGMLFWNTNATGMRGAQIRLNGTGALVYDFRPTTTTVVQETVIETYLNAGDYIELCAYQNSGANLNTSAHWLSARWVAA